MSAARILRLAPVLAQDAAANLRADARRNGLTLLGLVWGSASVVLLLSLGAGFTSFLDFGVEKTGDRYTVVEAGYTTDESGGLRPGRPIHLETRDVERVRAEAGSAAWTAGELLDRVLAETQWKSRSVVVAAAHPEIQRLRNHHLARGRFYDEREDAAVRPVVVLGATIAAELFPGRDPVGATLQLAGHPFRVVGVLEAKGFQFMTNWDLHDNMAFVPLSIGQRLLRRSDRVDRIVVAPRRRAEEGRLRTEVRAALWPRHRLAPGDDEAVAFQSVSEIMGPIRNVFVALEILLGGVGTVTLAMSGVGVANLMIAQVQSRRRELAMRRACGARRSDLMLQVLLETGLTVAAGGVLGVLVALAICFALATLPLPDAVPAPRVSLRVLVTTVAVLAGVGLAAGILPARMAAAVDPSVALRAG